MGKLAAAVPIALAAFAGGGNPLSALGGSSGLIGSIGSVIQGLATQKSSKSQATQSTGTPLPPAETPFDPKKPAATARPDSLSGYGNFDPTQERSAIATKGVNAGLGGDEDSYYKNLVSRSLIGDDNKITGDQNSLLPVESQYFSKKGYDTSNVTNLLKAIMGG